jgi:hypothetical protein
MTRFWTIPVHRPPPHSSAPPFDLIIRIVEYVVQILNS